MTGNYYLSRLIGKKYYELNHLGNVMAEYTRKEYTGGGGEEQDVMTLSNFPIYGSSRLGVLNVDKTIDVLKAGMNDTVKRYCGAKMYQMENHLGDVYAVVSDIRVPTGGTASGESTLIKYFKAEVKSINDYYPYGSLKPARGSNPDDYEYGMNGQRKLDKAVTGKTGGLYIAKYWIYNSQTGVRWNRDPKPTFGVSDYACFAGNPIWLVDINGDRPRIDRENRRITANLKLRDVSGSMTDAEKTAYGAQIQGNINSTLQAPGSNGFSTNVTVEWSKSRGGLFGTGLFAGTLSSNVFFDVERGGDRSSAAKSGNRGRFNLDDLDAGSNTAAHEFGHMLGLSDRYNYWATIRRTDKNNPTGQIVGSGQAPMTTQQVSTDPNQTNNNLFSAGSILTEFQIGIIFSKGPRVLRGEQSYTQIVAFSPSIGITTIDFVRGRVSLNSAQATGMGYIQANSVPSQGIGNVKGNLDGRNNYYNGNAFSIINSLVHR